jgi:hypothetical protein
MISYLPIGVAGGATAVDAVGGWFGRGGGDWDAVWGDAWVVRGRALLHGLEGGYHPRRRCADGMTG